MTCVGIVGGLGVGAATRYYEKAAACCTARSVVPDLVIAHADNLKPELVEVWNRHWPP